MKRAFTFLASSGLSCALFALLFALTLLGTLAQGEIGLYAAEKKYFESIFLVHSLGGVLPLPLPGGYLVLGVLGVNLVCGGIVRIRKGIEQIGTLVAHVGVAGLLVVCLVNHEWALQGTLSLYEGDQSAEAVNYEGWEIAIAQPGAAPLKEYVIPGAAFSSTQPGQARTFSHPDLPFTFVINAVFENTRPMAVAAGSTATSAVDGFYLTPIPSDKEASQNIAGAYVSARENASATVHNGILWGMERAPWTIDSGGKAWIVSLRRPRFVLPFSVKLDKFTRELHPRTNTPKAFMSDVTITDGNVSQAARISMNEPLRHKGYTFYQSSWGPPEAQPGEPLFSVLSVVRNPLDHGPLWCSLVITAGLLWLCLVKLLRYLRAEGAKSVEAAKSAEGAGSAGAAKSAEGAKKQ